MPLSNNPITELNAVNTLLRAVHLAPVGVVTATLDSRNAYAALDNSNTVIQGKGWHVNTLENAAFTPDGSDEVVIDPEFLTVRPAVGSVTWTAHPRLAKRGGKLYDLVSRSLIFTEPTVFLDIIHCLDWDDLPPALRWYIMYDAALGFVPQTVPVPAAYRFSADGLIGAKTEAQHEDEILRGMNLPETSPHFAKMRQR